MKVSQVIPISVYKSSFHCVLGFCPPAFYLECFKIVDEDIGQPEVVDELQVDGDHGARVRGVYLLGEALGDVQPGLPPHHVKIRAKLDAVFLKVVTCEILRRVEVFTQSIVAIIDSPKWM